MTDFILNTKKTLQKLYPQIYHKSHVHARFTFNFLARASNRKVEINHKLQESRRCKGQFSRLFKNFP